MQIPMVEVFVKTLGIVGLGEIGTELAKRAHAFDMKILYYKRRRLSEEAERELGIEYCSLDDLLRESDFVSLHVPHTKETDKLIGQRELALMKPSAFLINTSRGGVVDEDALYEALASKTITGAGLDVFREEPLPASSPLLKLDNVVLTPHIGGGSGEPNLYKEIHDVLANVDRVARGEDPQYILSGE
jgi:phosphoglycerate dehydrogenase-like enzyme